MGVLMSGGRSFRFGVLSHDWNWTSTAAWQDKVRRIEAMGYSTFLIPDHLNEQFGPIPTLTMAAAATTTLRLGTSVLSNDFRHPVMLAKDIATLDLFSDGRVELGLGAGWKAEEYEQAGMPFDTGRVRVRRLAESLHVLKELFRGDPLTFHGEYYTISGLAGTPRPVQQPHPPLLSGGGGKGILTVAAREADIVSFIPRSDAAGPDWATATAAATRQKIEWVREAAGERFPQLELCASIYGLAVTENGGSVLPPLFGRFRLTEEEIRASPHFLIGSATQIAEALHEHREQYGFSYFILPEVFVESFAPVVARLAGT
jgi:probable F420-dependent oxidoreductase